MDETAAMDALAALAQPSRMAIFRLLVRTGPGGMPAGRIGQGLGIVASTLSGHLAVLRRAGLIRATRHQREIHYAAELAAVNDLVGFLVADCCDGRVDECATALALRPAPADQIS